MQNFDSYSTEKLYKAIANIESAEECKLFLEDICTIKEIQDMAQRLETAILLDEGKNYQEISSLVGVSTATISRVSRCLNYGDGGYKSIIAKIKDMEK